MKVALERAVELTTKAQNESSQEKPDQNKVNEDELEAREMRRLACALGRIRGEVRTEEDVFTLIGLPFLHPHHRNFGP